MADAAPQQITLTFPDGATRKVESGTTGLRWQNPSRRRWPSAR